MNNENNTDLLDKLRKHLESITPEEFNKHIEEFKDMGDITMGEFVNSLEDEPLTSVYTCPVTETQCDDECCTSPEHCNIQAGIDIGISNCEPEFMSESAPPSYEDAFEKDVCISFAKWIAPSWMGIWVEDKWMWECVNEQNELYTKYGYLTEEELYELYLKSI